jgi:hypothetical protein
MSLCSAYDLREQAKTRNIMKRGMSLLLVMNRSRDENGHSMTVEAAGEIVNYYLPGT